MLVTAARGSAVPDHSAHRHESAGSPCGRGRAAAIGKGPVAPAIVCFPFVGDQVGGSHRSAAKLIQHLDPARYAPLVLLHRLDGDVASLFRAEGIAVEPAPSEGALEGSSIGADAAFLITKTLRLARFLRGRGARIVHTNDGGTHVSWALPARLAGAKLLWHHRKDPDAKGLRWLAPWVAHRVVSVSRFAAPRPGLLSAARKCTVVHSPFDTEMAPVDRATSRGPLREELRCPPEARVIGFFGSLIARKRPLMFVDAIAEVRARAPDLSIAAPIFGHDQEGLAEAVRRRAEARGVADSVRLMGFRYPPEPWLAACDVLLVPAVDEPFGRTLIEAMLLGTVVVAAASGGNVEAIRDGETGCLVPPDDAAAFAEQIVRLARAPELGRAMAAAARQDATSRFGLRPHADAIMGVYDAMLARAAPQGSGRAGTDRAASHPEPERAALVAREPAGIAVSRDPGARIAHGRVQPESL
jgi:glycosyltransferase involved in cell wall biosynthesis